MASTKKVILIFAHCEGSELIKAQSPTLESLVSRGTVLSNVSESENTKILASCGAEQGETLWEAAKNMGFVVANYNEEHDLCILDIPGDINALEKALTPVMEAAERMTLIVIVGKNTVLYYGPNIARGKVYVGKSCPCSVAPTIAYVADFPIPAQCQAPISYEVLKDINFKLKEIQKLQTTVANMEAALERKSRQPWDKHDCA